MRIQIAVGLGLVASGGIDNDRVLGKAPIGMIGAGQAASDALFVAFVKRELQPGMLQQAGFTAGLRPQQ